jgi:hypothetical protein
VAIIAAASVVLVAGLGTAAFAFGPSLRTALNHPAATATAAPVDTHPTLSPDELSSVQQAATDQQTIIAADQAAAEAAAQAAATVVQAAPKATTTAPSGGLPAGAIVPSIPGTTSPDTTKCASGSASDNASGVAVCD